MNDLDRQYAAMFAALGNQTMLSSTGREIVFAPQHRLNGRADLSGTTGEQQLVHAGLDAGSVTEEQVAAYRAWRDTVDAESRREARLEVSPITNVETHGSRFIRVNWVTLTDGLSEVLASERIECIERWDSKRLNKMGRPGASVPEPNNVAIDRAITQLRALGASRGLRVSIRDDRDVTPGMRRRLAALVANRAGTQFAPLDATSPTVLLQVRAPSALIERVDSAATTAGVTRSEWVRRALEEALERAESL